MIKAVFFDIDGTLLSFKHFTVPQSAREAFRRLKKDGVKLFVATGRPLKDIKDLDGLEFDGLITTNGAHCLDARRKTISMEAIPSADIDALIEYTENNPPFECLLITSEGTAANYIGNKLSALYGPAKIQLPTVTNFREIRRDNILQMNLFLTPEREAEIMKNVLVNCHSSRGVPFMADVNKRGVSKQSGIDKMLRLHNIDLKNTMAFGDGGNDISMLRHVALGVAMGDAPADVKKAADYVTDAADADGIYNALEKLVWNVKDKVGVN